MPRKTWLSWSSGKDSAWALHVLRRNPDYAVTGLLTTVNEAFDRVAMHATRRALVEAQADAAGVSLHIARIPHPCDNAQYEAVMRAVVAQAQAAGVECMAFGDLFLPDVRRYRVEKLAGTGIEPIFPVWEAPTAALAREMIGAGLRAIITCVDPRKLPREFAGREYGQAFLGDLPAGVDPCGENGEFHSFVYAGPMFRRSLRVRAGEIVERDGFVFADVLPT